MGTDIARSPGYQDRHSNSIAQSVRRAVPRGTDAPATVQMRPSHPRLTSLCKSGAISMHQSHRSSTGRASRLVSLSLVEFATGFRNDIKAIADYCHERGVLCGIDAMQALGALSVDVQQMGVDFLAAGSHKWLLAPHTSGILYVSDDLLAQLKPRRKGWFSVAEPYDFFNYQQPLKAGAARFEHSIPGIVAVVGLDAVLGLFETIDGGMEAIEQRILGLTDSAIAGLRNLGYPVISSQETGERSGIVCFQPHPERADLAAEQIANELALRNIHVGARGGCVRISPHFYNVQAEIDALLNALEEIKLPPPTLEK